MKRDYKFGKKIDKCKGVNAGLLQGFCWEKSAEGFSASRILKYLNHLCIMDRVMNKDFSIVDENDIVTFLSWLEKKDYTEWTKRDYKISLKKFFKWLNDGMEPLFTEWVKYAVKNDKILRTEDVLSRKEVIRIVDKASGFRNKSFINILYESGSRIGEMMNLRIRDVKFGKYFVVLRIHGRRVIREIPVKSSLDFLKSWLNNHPAGDDKNSFVWTHLDNPKLLCQNYFRKILKEAAKKAGIIKRVNPTMLRHARVMHLMNKLNGAQMRYFFGLTVSTGMPGKYYSSPDLDDAILRLNGIKKEDSFSHNVRK